MKMSKYILKRLVTSVFVLFGLSMVIFVLTRAVPGDPARVSLGPMAPEWAVDKLREELHLNDPIHIQYYIWLSNAFKGDLGMSVTSKRPVLDDFMIFFPASMELVLFSVLMSTILSVFIGVYTGRNANSTADNAFRLFSYLGIAVPSFVWAVLALFTFGYYWKVLPTMGQLTVGMIRPPVRTGMLMIDTLLVGDFAAFVDHVRHMILPSIVMSIARLAQDSKILRAGVVENLKKDYIMAATSYGIPERIIVMKYLLKPSLIPMVSILGLEIAGAIGGSFIIETIFSWPGFGKYGMNSMLLKDLNPIMASVMLIGMSCAFFNILVDVIVAYLDPRIRVMDRSN